jgi:hypothetical protein
VWEDLYRSVSPAQQSELLALAGRQGLVYAHQLPAAGGNGPPPDRNRQLLARMLSGQARDVEPAHVGPVEPIDTGLDGAQREAVARALHTPDVCLIQGLPGTGKSRVVAEILTQAVARGERVLFLAPSSAAIDRALTNLAGRPTLCPVRCLGRDENVAALPPASRSMTLADRARRLLEETLPRAREAAQSAQQTADGRRREESAWDGLRTLAERRQELTARTEALGTELAGVGPEVERDAGDPAAPENDFTRAARALCQAHADSRSLLDATLTDAERKIAEKHKEQDALTAKFDALRPLADAKEHKRWWTGTWWRATFQGDVLTQAAELQKAQQQVQTDLEELERQAAAAREARDREDQTFAGRRKGLVEEEVARRETAVRQRQAAVAEELAQVEKSWQGMLDGLLQDTPRPAEASAAAVAQARGAWERLREQDGARAELARDWSACLEETAGEFPVRLLGICNLVAATTTTLPADLHFGDNTRHPVHFDLLVLEEADQITESEFVNVARRARRWVLVGQPTPDPDHEEPPARHAPRGRGPVPRRHPTPPALRPGFFQRLWQHLHCDPLRLPAAWVREKDRLCCQMRPVTPEQSQWLESERLADRPDVELRILAMPRCAPQLAEVVFPAGMPIDEAKGLLFQELQELPVRALGRSLRWVEEPERVLLQLADVPATRTTPVHLEAGVREMVVSGGPDANAWHTCCVEFDRGAGWSRPRAEAWVQRHLGVRDLGRTARLDAPYRMRPDLAAFLSDLLYDGAYLRAHSPGDASPVAGPSPVEFVAVPPLREAPRSRPREGAKVAARTQTATLPRASAPAVSRQAGAGLELDLSDGRHRERLPDELRPSLPDRGLVNYLEAQAVVRALEALVKQPGLAETGGDAAVGVIALYPAQAELIRRLVHQSPDLASAGVPLKIDVPAAFQEQECGVVLLSLTRSHTHRAVSFGEGPQSLAMALTRARTRLVLFGDPGTLVRRSQWEAALDHLDEAASAREREILGQLVDYLHGRGPHPHAFHLVEGAVQ